MGLLYGYTVHNIFPTSCPDKKLQQFAQDISILLTDIARNNTDSLQCGGE